MSKKFNLLQQDDLAFACALCLYNDQGVVANNINNKQHMTLSHGSKLQRHLWGLATDKRVASKVIKNHTKYNKLPNNNNNYCSRTPKACE